MTTASIRVFTEGFADHGFGEIGAEMHRPCHRWAEANTLVLQRLSSAVM